MKLHYLDSRSETSTSLLLFALRICWQRSPSCFLQKRFFRNVRPSDHKPRLCTRSVQCLSIPFILKTRGDTLLEDCHLFWKAVDHFFQLFCLPLFSLIYFSLNFHIRSWCSFHCTLPNDLNCGFSWTLSHGSREGSQEKRRLLSKTLRNEVPR